MDIDPKLAPAFPNLFVDGEHRAVCSFCSLEKVFQFPRGVHLAVGDDMPHDPKDPSLDTCPRCKHQTFKITAIPETVTVKKPTGFWKIPTE